MRLVLLLISGCLLMMPPSAQATATRTVLMLFSNNRSLPANIEATRGLHEGVNNAAGAPVDVFEEFLDLPAFSGPAFEQTFTTYLREKYATREPEVIVAAGAPALEFLLRHRASFFQNVPVVHLAVDKTLLQSLHPLPADIVGVSVEYDFAGTIQLALHLHPEARRLVLVTGSSRGDHRWESQIRTALDSLGAPPTVEFLAGLSTDALEQRLRDLGPHDVVFTPGYFRDGMGREFSPRQSAAFMAAVSGAPVYGPFDTFIGPGIVGGRMPAYFEMGRQAADAVNALLAGTAASELNIPTSIPSVTQIDWRQVKKWNIAEADIPPETVVHFKGPTVWERYRHQAVFILAVLLLQAALIAALLIERRSRQRTTSALQESEKRMSLAAQASKLSTWVWDVSQEKLRLDPITRQDPGHAPIRFERILETVHPLDRTNLDSAVRQSIEKNEELDVEYRILAPDGEVRWVAARGRPEKGMGQHMRGVTLDITERKVAELQAGKDRAALTHMTRVSMMGQLSASIAHQLNQPLAAILGNAEAARKMLDQADPDLAELREICDDIVAENLRAAEVIRRLGALFRRGEMQLAPLDLNELVSETLELVRPELMTRQVGLATEFASRLPKVDGGRIQLQQVLLNLVLNAADAMNEIDPARRRLKVRTELDGSTVRLLVIDQGSGIAPEDIPKIFGAFWSTKADGTGIGLAICQSIVMAHCGTLTAANNPDGGATFCAAWPVRQHN